VTDTSGPRANHVRSAVQVSRRAHRHDDRAGDPLDGLVNLFDVGIVLAVAFLLAALSSLHLTGTLSRTGLRRPTDAVTAPRSATVTTVAPTGVRTVGRGRRVGTVYRLRDGQLVVVLPSGTPTVPGPTPSPGPS
jgi:hypothetical protein